MPKAGRACLSSSCSPTTPRCGSAARPRAGCARRPRPSWSRRSAPRTRPASRCWCSAGGSNLVVADDGLRRHRRRGRDPRHQPPTSRTATLVRRRRWSPSPPARTGTTWSRGPSSRAGSASRRCPASRARSARPRSRTSAPTARRSARPSRRSGSGTAGSAGVRTFANADCGFGYRTSASRPTPAGTSCSSVTFQLRAGRPRRAGRVRRAGPRARRRAGRARAARRRPRRGARRCGAARAWCSTPADHDTWSAGSFFTNPVVARRRRARRARRRGRSPTGPVKTSAAWLIEHAGFGKGYGSGRRRRCPAKHTLALTNRGGATTADLLALAREVRDGVEARFGIRLVNEPVLVGCEL